MKTGKDSSSFRDDGEITRVSVRFVGEKFGPAEDFREMKMFESDFDRVGEKLKIETRGNA